METGLNKILPWHRVFLNKRFIMKQKIYYETRFIIKLDLIPQRVLAPKTYNTRHILKL